jgi:hypothetical protein
MGLVKHAPIRAAVLAAALAALAACAETSRVSEVRRALAGYQKEFPFAEEVTTYESDSRFSKLPKDSRHFTLYEPHGNELGRIFSARLVGEGGNAFKLKADVRHLIPLTRKYLTTKDRHALKRMTLKGKHRMTRKEVAYYLGVGAKTYLDQTLYVDFEDFDPESGKSEIMTMLKLVRGHRRNRARKVDAPLPWMREFPDLAQEAREGSEFVYELARGANDGDAENFRFCMALLVEKAVQDVLSRGGRLEDAVVYIHTVRDTTKRHFTQNFPWKVWKEPKPGHAVLKASLKSLINDVRFRPYEYFEHERKLIEALKPEAPSDVLEFAHAAAKRLEFSFELKDRSGKPVARASLYDHSELSEYRLRLLMAKHGISRDGFDRALREVYGFSNEVQGGEYLFPVQDARETLARMREELAVTGIDVDQVRQYYDLLEKSYRARAKLADQGGGLGAQRDVNITLEPYGRASLDLAAIDYSPVMDFYRGQYAELARQAADLRDLGIEAPRLYQEAEYYVGNLQLNLATWTRESVREGVPYGARTLQTLYAQDLVKYAARPHAKMKAAGLRFPIQPVPPKRYRYVKPW